MRKFIDITDRKKLNLLLSALKPDTPGLWGTMTAHDMVEHLIDVVAYTNGRKTTGMDFSEEESNRRKHRFVYSDDEMTRNIKLSDIEEQKIKMHPNLQSSIDGLNKELDDFETYYSIEGRKAIHPAFGAMDHKEWLMMHGKHFTHHFKQFGLIV